MESVKKWLSDRTTKRNGLYGYSSPPKLLGPVPSAQLRLWARGGQQGRLERAAFAGQGRRLLAECLTGPLPNHHHLPALVDKCEALHRAVEKGSLLELQGLLDTEYNRRKFAACLDEAGVGLLHKAVYYNFTDIAEWLVHQFPSLVHQRDSEGRTPLHYAAASKDAGVAALLEGAGASRGARDVAGHTPAHYRARRSDLTLPTVGTPDMARDGRNPPGLVIKRHNIRIWCHDCDMAKLQRVVWEGHGKRLLNEVSNQPVVKRFLEAVPYLMNTIKDIHNSVVQNDLEGLMRHAAEPVPPVVLSSRDQNSMTVLHKAAGLGHVAMLRYITGRYPEGINDVDKDGRTPLHYAAANRDDMHAYNSLVALGADESVLDNKNKTPVYYINRPQEIDKNILKTVPDAPRTPSSTYPASWDWNLLYTEVIAELNKKSRRRTKASNDNVSSTNTNSESTKDARGMKQSSTHEFIKNLPGLNEVRKSNEYLHQEPEKVETTENEHNGIEHEPEIEPDEPEIATNGNEHVEDKNIDDSKQEEPVHETIESNELELENKDENKPEKETESHEGTENSIAAEPSENQEQAIKEDEKSEQADLKEENEKDKVEEENNSEQQEDKTEPPKTEEPPKVEEEEESLYTMYKDERNHKTPDHAPDESEEKTTEPEVRATDETENKTLSDKDEVSSTAAEGNHNSNSIEDDEDVQVQGETQSEYSESNLRSTAEASDRESSKRGNTPSGRITHESLIEGLINGDNELDTEDASGAQAQDGTDVGEVLVVENEIDPEVSDLINSANMEMLAALVLNGEGGRLVGRRSRNQELQAFLNNVPSYMKKIQKVHLAAREGNIRDLQAALDRRKFAIARDPVSPNGATPLHVATVFGKTNIIKYLGGRFPETLSAVDFEGRTALHYAAVLPDNGYYYNLLQQLGANAKDLDDNAQSAEQYHNNPDLLPFNQLASEFKVTEDMVQDMLSDRVPEDRVSSRRSLDNPETLETLERCYRLLSSAKPSRTPLSASSNNATPPLVLGRFLRRPVFEAIKKRVTKLDHNLFDVIWPAVKKLPTNRNIIQTVEVDFSGGIMAPDYYAYEVFAEFFIPLLKDMHNMNVHSDLSLHPPSDFINKKPLSASSSSEPLVELDIDPNNDFVLSGNMECMRNLKGFESPLNLSINQLEYIETILTAALMREEFSKFSQQSKPESEQKGGSYYTLIEVLDKPSEICATLASAGLLIALCDAEESDDTERLHGRHWPYGRGVYVSDDKTVAIWINVLDHLRVVTCTPTDTPGEIGLLFSRLTYIMTYLHEYLDFVLDPYLGHLSSRPNFIGAGIRFSLVINFVGLSKDPDNLKHLCAMRGLQLRETVSSDIWRVSNYQSLSMTETKCFNDFATAASNLLHLEKDLSVSTNSTHIATMLTNIFKRKRKSLIEQASPEHN